MNPAYQILIPFSLSEGPRIFLSWLEVASTLPEDHRKRIGAWLENYNLYLKAYIESQYGQEVFAYANELSGRLGQVFLEEVGEARERLDIEFFERLEDEMFGGDGASPAGHAG